MTKLFVDSRFRTLDSASSSDFTIELTENLTLPPRCKVRVHDLSIPFSWWTVEPGLNTFLYISEKTENQLFYRVLSLPVGQYDGPRLATALGAALNGASIYAVQGAPNPFTVAYSDSRGNLTITLNVPGELRIYPDIELRTLSPWPFSGGGTALQPQSFNRNLRITASTPVTVATPFFSEFVNLRTIDCLYLTSSTLGNLSNIGPRPGQRNVLAMVAVTSGWGYLNHSEGESWEWTDCSGNTLKRVSFRLEDATGAVVPLHGLDISFALAFGAD